MHMNSYSSLLDEVLGLHSTRLDGTQGHGFRGSRHNGQAESGDGSTTYDSREHAAANEVAPSNLAKRGIEQRGDKRGAYTASSNLTASTLAKWLPVAAARPGRTYDHGSARRGVSGPRGREGEGHARRDAATAEPLGG
jgi:hypothetical protein